jgi:hypothetical protein
MLVDEHIPAPEHACLFKALILKDQAYIKLLEGHNKAAIKLSRKAISYAHGSTSEDSLRDCKYAEALCLYESDRFREAAPKLKALWKMFENAKHFPTPTNNHRLRQEVLSMLRVSHFRLNEIGAASQVQGTMYELGYCAETAEEYQRRFKEEPGAATALTALRRWLGEQNVDEN